MQKFKFPMEYLRVTQGENTGSHLGSLAMDFGGKDTGSDKMYCPCDMKVIRTRENANGEMYLESLDPVMFADGTVDYARLLCIHDTAFNFSVGDVIPLGTYFYDEGGMGSGNSKQFATHVHMEAGKGKWASNSSARQYRNKEGVYVIGNQSHLYDLFVVGDDVIIMNDGGYKWTRQSELEKQNAPEKTPQPNGDGTVYGVDVSENRSVDVIKSIEANGKADFAILRVAVGSSREDKNLKRYIDDKGHLKIGFFTANYFYDNRDAVGEADYLINAIEKYGFTPETVDLPIFRDWEYFSNNWNVAQGRTLTPRQVRESTLAYCHRIQQRGYKAGVYLNKDFWDNWYGQDFFTKNPDLYIWYARPGLDKPDRDCYIWQYAANNGYEYGVGEPLDKNILYGSYLTSQNATDGGQPGQEQGSTPEPDKTTPEAETPPASESRPNKGNPNTGVHEPEKGSFIVWLLKLIFSIFFGGER